MEKPKTHIDVKISIESIRDSLRKRIVSENSHMIANVIISNLEITDKGLEQLYKSLGGIQDTPKFKVGDWIRVNMDKVYSYQFDKDRTRKEGEVSQGALRCQITSVDMRKAYPYELVFKAYSTGGDQKEFTSAAKEEWLCLDDEWPEDLGIDDDLPF